MRTHRTAGGPPALGLLAATLTLLLSAAACTDDDPDPRDPSSTWSPTGTMDPPSPTATEPVEPTEPVLPDAAKQASEDGARAFITYYWDLINYAQATGDVDGLRRTSADTCSACTDLANQIHQLYVGGGKITGGVNDVSVLKAAKLTTGSGSARGFKLVMDVAHDDQIVLNGDGTREDRSSGSDTFRAYLLWVDQSRWRVDVLEVI